MRHATLRLIVLMVLTIPVSVFAATMTSSGFQISDPITTSAFSNEVSLSFAIVGATSGQPTDIHTVMGSKNYKIEPFISATFSTNIITYTTTASVTGSNGTINCTPTVNNGATATCTITPAAGYQLATFTDNTIDKMSSVTNGLYSIINVISNHNIASTFSLTPSTPANGECGTSNGTVLAAAPTTNFCTTGTATAVSGTGPWSWNCTGTNGGTTATCQTAGIVCTTNYDPVCGNDGKTYSNACVAGLAGVTVAHTGVCTVTSKSGDCDNSGTVTIAEVQSAINMFLGLKQVAGCVNTSGDNVVSIAEVQKAINSFLGL